MYRIWVQDLTYKKVGPSNKLSSWASWSVKQRLVLPSSVFFFTAIFNSKSQCIKNCLRARTVYLYMWWIDLELCTGDCWNTWPTKVLVHPASWASWSVKQRLVLPSSFLFVFFYAIFNCRSQCIKICLRTRTVYMYMHGMDLELCTGDGCKTWPTKGLVHPTKSLPELLDLWSKYWSYLQVFCLFFFLCNFQL